MHFRHYENNEEHSWTKLEAVDQGYLQYFKSPKVNNQMAGKEYLIQGQNVNNSYHYHQQMSDKLPVRHVPNYINSPTTTFDKVFNGNTQEYVLY